MGGTVIDTVIGMVFVYLLLSLLCSAAQELISGLLRLRSRTLRKGLQILLHEDGPGDFSARFFAHPLIDRLAPKDRFPSYLPAEQFSATVMDLIRSDASVNPFDKLPAAIDSLPESDLQRSLSALAYKARGNVDDFIGELERWFDNTTDRVSGWYKRSTQFYMLLVALALSAAFNIDSIRLADSLWHDQAQREAMVSMADQFLQQNGTIVAESSQDSPTTAVEQISNRRQQAIGLLNEIDKLPLPIGWNAQARESFCPLVILGWLISACFISLGAPFWFNTLSKVLSLRASGGRPAKKPLPANE